MSDPLTLAIAAAIAGKATEGMTEQARQAVSAVVARLRAKLRRHPADLAVVAAESPEPETVARILDREFTADPGFRDEIRTLWATVSPTATGDAVVNSVSGQAGKVVQLRDAHGDISL